ncbi:MAG TPA: PQQ-binding-like beta-propeller repeat protein [Candidatus Acidoferrales bacterium]|jgi:outer membrane protein assembly factor BamB|nr:PQQ-binding-like beta-propeller repeat protein [Candidatus Acidoferrales bacterium]
MRTFVAAAFALALGASSFITSARASEPGLASFGGVAWRVQTGGMVRSTPAFAGGTLYAGSNDGNLYALDASDGAIRWKYDTGARITSRVVAAGAAVYVQTQTGKIVAVDAANGTLRWQRQTGADAPLAWGYESGDFWASSPAIANGVLAVGSGDGSVYALDAATGAILWKTQTGGRVRATPAIAGDTVYAGSFDGKLYALNLRDGAVKWTYSTTGTTLDSSKFGYDRRSIQSSPVVANGTVFFGARDGFVYAIDAATGTLRWRYDHKISWINTTLAIDGGMVYDGSSDKQFVQALDESTGAERWRTPDGTMTLVWSSPVVWGNALFDADWNARVVAIDKTNGHVLWTDRLGWQRILSSVVVAGDRLFYGSDDGGIYALKLSRGPGLRRAVFFDPAYAKASTVAGGQIIETYFEHRSYAPLDAPKLAAFLTARIGDRTPSVVVFAQDVVPDKALLRRYLDAGGKVVWLGNPPLVFPLDLQGNGDPLAIDRKAAGAYLGVSFERSNFDAAMSHVTPTGVAWGVNAVGSAIWPADPHTVSTVLALDEDGLAAAWVKNYGGAPGTGFVRIPAYGGFDGTPLNLANVQFAAEYLPAR